MTNIESLTTQLKEKNEKLRAYTSVLEKENEILKDKSEEVINMLIKYNKGLPKAQGQKHINVAYIQS